MPATPDDLFACLDRLGIAAATHTHAPAHTVAEGNAIWGAIAGVHCKNLFLKDAKARYWLVVAPTDRAIDLKTLPERIGSARLSFGSADRLRQVLGVEPGSVTPFALLNDTPRQVRLVVDRWMMTQGALNFHPLRNTMTTTIATADFRRFLAHTGHVPAEIALEPPP